MAEIRTIGELKKLVDEIHGRLSENSEVQILDPEHERVFSFLDEILWLSFGGTTISFQLIEKETDNDN